MRTGATPLIGQVAEDGESAVVFTRAVFPRNLTPAQAIRLQRELAERVQLRPYRGLPRYVAGVDVAFSRKDDLLWGGIAVFQRAGWRLVEKRVVCEPASFPYVPGLLSFREIPVVLKAARGLKTCPDVVLVDGQGLAHPRRLGLASHLGLIWNIPTVGCAKSRLVGETRGSPGRRRGSRRILYDRGEKVGALIRTRDGVKPVWVSPGNLTDIPSASRIALACCARYRLPEPVRLAHMLVGEAKRGAERGLSGRLAAEDGRGYN